MQHTYLGANRLVATLTAAALFVTLYCVSFATPALAQDDPFAHPAPAVANLPAAPAAPSSATATDSVTINLAADEDAYVIQSEPTINTGQEPDLIARRAPAPGFTLALWAPFIHWRLPAFPSGTIIESADLQLYQTTGDTSGLGIYLVTSDWQDTSIAYATLPTLAGYDSTWVPPATTNTYITHSVTSLVQNWVSGQLPNYGIALAPIARTTTERIFNSRENAGKFPPRLHITYQLPPIQVCYFSSNPCSQPAAGAEVFDVTTNQVFIADKSGYIPAGVVRLGDALWARFLDNAGNPDARSRLYSTSGAPQIANASAFIFYNGEASYGMPIVVSPFNRLMLYDLNVSTQWYLDDNPAQIDWLRQNLIRASDFLYDFTNGQFALGTVHVQQVYEGWDAANIRVHSSNTFHPNANVGGIVQVETPDIQPSIPMTYTPGKVYIGSYWNRFGTPPNQVNTYQGKVVPPAVMADDWAVALAHELSHYLLYLFDTYVDQNGVSSQAIADQCTGSAMANAYLRPNHAFIASQTHWDNACGQTGAHAWLNGRTEWATILAWYNWVSVPEVAAPDIFPPVPLTTVIFDPPNPGDVPSALASQVFTLTYQANETSSGEARAFLIRDDSFIYDQGKPAKNSSTVQLTDARLGDRLCVYDINDHAEENELPRQQFGCKVIVAGDSDLIMTRNVRWQPLVTIDQTGPQSVHVTVNQTMGPTATLSARLFSEYGPAGSEQVLTRSGDQWQSDFNFGQPVTPVYLQLWVNETPVAPRTRREVVADWGTGGDGAFGPARLYSGVMAISSDGNAGYENDTPIDLLPGQSIAWQSMPGTPFVPPWKQISGQSYRLTAFPANLVNGGRVTIKFRDAFGVMNAAEAAALPTPAIHFWDGEQWRKLETTIGTPAGAGDGGGGPEDGILQAIAPSQGVGVYAVMIDSKPALFVPWVSR